MTTTSTSAVSNSNLISSLGAGSGIDTKSLATNLVDAERAPLKASIDTKITKTEAKISGYSAISFAASALRDAFGALNDQTDFNSISVRNSNTSAFSVTTGSTAALGDYKINVLSLALPQRSVSEGFADTTTPLSTSDIALNLTIGGTSTSISVTAANSNPGGIVDAINNSGTGVTAQLINKGYGSTSDFRIVLTGTTGASQSFTLGSTPALASLDFNTETGTPNFQAATDASIEVNGVGMTRSTNSISNAIKGVTLDLFETTANAATVNLTRDSTALKEKLNAVVTAYNDANSMLAVVANRDSTVPDYGGSLFGDSTVRLVQDQLRSMVTSPSTTPGTNASALWQLGVSLGSDGKLSLDSTKLDTALNTNFDNVVKMMTGNTNNLTSFSTTSAGIAGDAYRKLGKMIAKDGILATQSTSATTQVDKYKLDLTKLEDRMTKLLLRYQTQFAAMDSIVGQANSTRTSLKSTFDGMSASNKA